MIKFKLFKRFNEKKEKRRLIDSLESLQQSLTSMHLYKVTSRVDRIIDKLDCKEKILNTQKIEVIKKMISSMNAHLDKSYETLLINKCDQIMKTISGESIIVDNKVSERKTGSFTVISSKNEDQEYEMLAELDAIDHEIEETKEKIKDSIGKSNNLSRLLRGKLQSLVNKKTIKSKNYNAFIANKTNMTFANDLAEGEREASEIASESEKVDISELKAQATFIRGTSDDVQKTSDSIDEVMTNIIGPETDDFEFDKELEEELLKESSPRKENKNKKVQKSN